MGSPNAIANAARALLDGSTPRTAGLTAGKLPYLDASGNFIIAGSATFGGSVTSKGLTVNSDVFTYTVSAASGIPQANAYYLTNGGNSWDLGGLHLIAGTKITCNPGAFTSDDTDIHRSGVGEWTLGDGSTGVSNLKLGALLMSTDIRLRRPSANTLTLDNGAGLAGGTTLRVLGGISIDSGLTLGNAETLIGGDYFSGGYSGDVTIAGTILTFLGGVLTGVG